MTLTINAAVADLGFEVLPFKGTAEKVIQFVPTNTPLTVTASPAKGIDATIELSETLKKAGYHVAPHLSARMIKDRAKLKEIVSHLKSLDINSAFIVGGDQENPEGKFLDGLTLLQELDSIGHHFTDLGIGGYPEGHAFIPNPSLDKALVEKSKFANYVTTQICFTAEPIVTWARHIKNLGVDIPIRVGIPGAVTRQKLLRISLASGVGESVKFLKKQQNMFWRFFVPGGYSPDKLIRDLGPYVGQEDNNLAGFHVFTFNDIDKTQQWREKLDRKYVKA